MIKLQADPPMLRFAQQGIHISVFFWAWSHDGLRIDHNTTGVADFNYRFYLLGYLTL